MAGIETFLKALEEEGLYRGRIVIAGEEYDYPAKNDTGPAAAAEETAVPERFLKSAIIGIIVVFVVVVAINVLVEDNGKSGNTIVPGKNSGLQIEKKVGESVGLTGEEGEKKAAGEAEQNLPAAGSDRQPEETPARDSGGIAESARPGDPASNETGSTGQDIKPGNIEAEKTGADGNKQKFLEVSEPFSKKVLTRRRQEKKLDFGVVGGAGSLEFRQVVDKKKYSFRYISSKIYLYRIKRAGSDSRLILNDIIDRVSRSKRAKRKKLKAAVLSALSMQDKKLLELNRAGYLARGQIFISSSGEAVLVNNVFRDFVSINKIPDWEVLVKDKKIFVRIVLVPLED